MIMKPVNPKILNEIPDERIEARVWYFEEAFRLSTECTDLEHHLRLNRDTLYIATKSYFLDVERLKYFHGITLIEGYKIAAYTVKWITKMRPVYFPSSKPSSATTQMLLFNEQYALQLGSAMAEIPDSIITRQFMEEALYTLHYRSLSVDLLTMWFRALGGSEEMKTG